MAARTRKEALPKERDYVAIAYKYAVDVTTGRVPACKWVRLACQRHLTNLKQAKDKAYPYQFDEAAAVKICAFAEALPHVKGKWAKHRELIRLGAWQCFILCSLFGWLRKGSGMRRFREAYLEIPRKNGKSILAAIIGLYMLTMDDEYGAEVYSGATTEKQAWEVFRPAKQMFDSPEAEDLREMCGGESWAKAMNTAEGGRFEPLIGKPGDGSSPSCAIADEFHEHDTPDQVDTMQTGMGAREQPLMLIVTTAGTNLAGPCFDKRDDAKKVLEDTAANDEMFCIIYSIDEPEFEGDKGDDWTDPKVLVKANPNYDVSVFADFLLAEQRKAVQNPIHATRFRTKHLNQWCGAKMAWMPIPQWNLCRDPDLSIDEFKGQPAVFMLDLASRDDIAAFGTTFFKDLTVAGKVQRHYYHFAKYYIPERQLYNEDNPNSAKYQKWHAQGLLTVTPGAEIDFGEIRTDVLEYKDRFQCKELGYDPWRATQLAQECREAGAETVEVRQTVQNLSGPMKEVLSAVKGLRLHHDGNPITSWMVANVVAQTDKKDNIYPTKEKTQMKIDGAVVLIMGVARAMLTPDTGSIDDWLKGGPVVAVRGGKK